MGWGPDMLTVEAKSQERAAEIAAQLGQLGFKAIQNEDNAYAGMLDLSRNPEAILSATQARIASLDVSRRRWIEQIVPLIWALCSLVLIPGISRNMGRVGFPVGILALAMFFWDGSRIWGWKLEILPSGLRVRRRFREAMIPWDQICSVNSLSAGRNQEAVVLGLASRRSERLGTFDVVYARNLRDRLRYELAKHAPNHP